MDLFVPLSTGGTYQYRRAGQHDQEAEARESQNNPNDLFRLRFGDLRPLDHHSLFPVPSPSSAPTHNPALGFIVRANRRSGVFEEPPECGHQR